MSNVALALLAAFLLSASVAHALSPDHPRKDDRDGPYNIDGTTWAWIPVLILGLFTSLMLMSVKSDRWFDGLSLRLYLMRYVSVETLYNSLLKATAHEWKEQRDIEIGHQVFTVFGIVLLLVNVFFNPNADQRYAMAVLTYLQIFMLVGNVVCDIVLIQCLQRVDVVRSVNTKLRFSHCIYQVILFCSEVINSSSLHLPVDCFVWATIHYSYEAVGLALEGLNVIGMSEFAIIALVNAQILGTDVASTGWTCAFGMSSLFLSVVSILIGQIYKWRQVLNTDRLPPGHHEGLEDPHDEQSTEHELLPASCRDGPPTYQAASSCTAPPMSTTASVTDGGAHRAKIEPAATDAAVAKEDHHKSHHTNATP